MSKHSYLIERIECAETGLELTNEREPMTKDEFTELGALLYGANWKCQLARALDKNPSMIHRWATGDRPVPLVVAMALQGLARQRAIELASYTGG